MRRSLLFLTFLVVTVAGRCASERDRLILGPVHSQKPERVEVLVELPEGVAAAPSDFQLLEDGRASVRAVELKSLKESGWTAAAVLVVDTSGSMKKKIEMVKAALPDFIGQFQGPLALITFGDEPAVVAAFDAPRDQLLASISQLRAVSKETRLYAAVDKALGLLQTQPQPERQRIILVSDGEEESQQDSSYLDGVISKASSRRVAIDTVWTARAPYSSRDTMVRLSERTDGVHGDAQNADQIRAALGQVIERTNDARVVFFDRKVGDGLTRELGLSLNGAGVEPAIMALASPIPQSAPLAVAAAGETQPPQAPKDLPSIILAYLKFLWGVIKDIRSWLVAAGTVGSAYAAYTASYVTVRRYRPASIVLFPFNPLDPFHQSSASGGGSKEDDQKLDGQGGKPRRVTVVDHGTSEQPASLVLEAVKGPLKGKRISIDKEYFSIGADPDNDLTISSDAYVSAKHAAIRSSGAGWVLVDQGSTNGTFVDGNELTSESQHALQPGEVIQVGDSEFRVVSEASVKAASAASSSSQSQTRLT